MSVKTSIDMEECCRIASLLSHATAAGLGAAAGYYLADSGSSSSYSSDGDWGGDFGFGE